MLHLRRFLSVTTVAACSLTFLLATSASSSAAAAAARPVRLGEGGAETTETATTTTKRKRKQKRRALGSKGSKGSKGSSKGSKGSKGGKGKGGGKGGRPSRPSSGPRTIYETVEFVVFSTGDDLCGDREDVAPGLESAFLKYWEEEAEECDSDRDVETAVLTLWEEAPSCSGSESESESKSRRRELEPSAIINGNGDDASQGRRLQNTQRSRGRFNRRSSCSRCRRRLVAEDGGDGRPGPFDLVGRTRRLSKGSKGSKGGGKGGSSKGSKGGGKGGGDSSESCSVDPVDFLIDAGFEDVYRVRITSIEEADCYDLHSKDCTSTKLTRGACCGMCGCACSYPSESLCEAEDYCLGGARPFEMDFCEDFVPDGEDAGACKKESCDDDNGNGSKDKSHSK